MTDKSKPGPADALFDFPEFYREVSDEDWVALEFLDAQKRRLADLDDDHKRATTPWQRREIEAKARDLRKEVARLDELKKKVDEAHKAWEAAADAEITRSAEAAGYTREEMNALFEQMERETAPPKKRAKIQDRYVHMRPKGRKGQR